MAEVIQEIAHSSIGASSAYRWMKCPASVALSKGIPNMSSKYAAEGTVAHEVCELCLIHNHDADFYAGDKFISDVEGEPTEFTVTDEMVDAVQLYVDTVRKYQAEMPLAELKVEVGFNLDHIHEGLFGTNDACLIEPYGRLVIIDYKNGQKFVEATKNKQLMYYAIGAGHELGYEFTSVEMVIVQPHTDYRDGGVRSYTMSVDELLAWGEELGKAAEETKNPDAKFEAGDHCGWCPSKNICNHRRDEATSKVLDAFNGGGEVVGMAEAKDLTPEQLAEALKFVDKIADIVTPWVKDIKSYAQEQMEKGVEIEGWKLTRGRKGNRKMDDAEGFEAEHHGEFGDEIFEPKKLKSPAQLDKVVGKDIVNKWVDRAEGKYKIVPESASAKAVEPPKTAKALFGQ